MKIKIVRINIKAIALLLTTIVTLWGCSDKKSEERRDSDTISSVTSEARTAPETPDYDLYEVKGDVAYIVLEKFMDTGTKNLEQGDSIRFNDKGWWIGTSTWSGSGRERSVYEDISLSYTAEGEFENGRDTGIEPEMKIVIERNDSLQLAKIGRLDSGNGQTEEAAYTVALDWAGNNLKRRETSGYGWSLTERFKFKDGELMPSSLVRVSEDEDGRVEESITYEYKEFDNKGNWTQRIAHVEERVRDYDVETGKIVQVGEVRKHSYLERRRIGYRP